MKSIFKIILSVIPVCLYAAENPEADLKNYEKKIEPLLSKYCIACHGPDKVKAELRIDRLDPDIFTGPDADHWEEVYNQLNIGDMPPEDEPQPNPAERELISHWVHSQLRLAAELKRSTGGSNVLRRLTRYEYSNTLRDLLGLDLDFSKDLPPEGAAKEGFVNNSAILGTSGLHIEYFQRIASSSLRKAVLTGEKPKPFLLEIEPEKYYSKPVEKTEKGKKRKRAPRKPVSVLNTELVDSGVLLSPSAPTRANEKRSSNSGGIIQITTREIPREGPLKITVKAKAKNSSDGIVPRLYIALGYDGGNSASPFGVLTSTDVTEAGFREYVFETRAERFPLLPPSVKQSQFLKIRNVFNRGTLEISDENLPGLIVDSIKIEGNAYSSWPPKTRTQIVGDPDEKIEITLKRFMTRAYRRPPTKEEVERMADLHRKLEKGGLSREDALCETLSAVLASPGFLLLAEPSDKKRRSLNSYEIASRLSYFLWSTMPDSQLFALAEEDKLTSPKVLASEVTRMLDDPKSAAFFENFSSQWFDLDGIYSVAVNPEFFPDFKDETKEDMIAETVEFFTSLVKENKSCLDLIDSDVAMLNADLAKHYGIPGVGGESFRAVKLKPEMNRGGLLTQASILTLNSSGDDTHPIKRGVWVLERLLGDPPPPPPPGVPTLAEDSENGDRKSLKEQLESHRQEEACMTCHQKIDPWGIVFENYDGIGVWRNSTSGNEPVLISKAVETKVKTGEDHFFPIQPPVKAPRIVAPTGAGERQISLVKSVNESLESLQRPHNHLRRLGSEGADDQLRRFLGYIEMRSPNFEDAVDKLLKETGQAREDFLAEFREANAEVIASNRSIREKAEAIAPPRIVEAKNSRKKRGKQKKKILRGVVDPKTTLADGTEIPDLSALKRYIIEQKRDQFTETVVRKLLAYSWGVIWISRIPKPLRRSTKNLRRMNSGFAG